jgi:hypothetical protein
MMTPSMDVSIHCDDLVIIEINISNLTTVKEIIHQVICSRRSMAPSIDLDFDDCILSVHDGSKLRLLSKESILFSVLKSISGELLTSNLKLTASGFRAKAIDALQTVTDHNYLIEKKTLELRYLVSSTGSKLPPDFASAAQLAKKDLSSVQDNLYSKTPLEITSSSRSSSSSSSSSSMTDISLRSNTTVYEILLKKYITFSSEVGEALRAEKSEINDEMRHLIEVAEGRLLMPLQFYSNCWTYLFNFHFLLNTSPFALQNHCSRGIFCCFSQQLPNTILRN